MKRERILDAVLEGPDVKCRTEARRLLRLIVDRCTEDDEINPLVRVAIPVARRLVAYRGWRFRITADKVIDYCTPRLAICQMLETMGFDDFYPEAEYLAGMVQGFLDENWNPTNNKVL